MSRNSRCSTEQILLDEYRGVFVIDAPEESRVTERQTTTSGTGTRITTAMTLSSRDYCTAVPNLHQLSSIVPHTAEIALNALVVEAAFLPREQPTHSAVRRNTYLRFVGCSDE